jgi:hypothetical protein
MAIPYWLTLFRKSASFALALCFILPLSQCNNRASVQEATVTKPVIYQGSDMAKDAFRKIEDGKAEGALTLLLVCCVFFLPLASLTCGSRVQVALHLAGSLLSGYVLYHWVFVFASQALPGGVIAFLCCLCLFATSLYEAVALWKNRRKRLHRSSQW